MALRKSPVTFLEQLSVGAHGQAADAPEWAAASSWGGRPFWGQRGRRRVGRRAFSDTGRTVSGGDGCAVTSSGIYRRLASCNLHQCTASHRLLSPHPGALAPPEIPFCYLQCQPVSAHSFLSPGPPCPYRHAQLCGLSGSSWLSPCSPGPSLQMAPCSASACDFSASSVSP